MARPRDQQRLARERIHGPAGPLVDEETGLGGLAAAADVKGVDDVREAEPHRGLG